MFSARSVVRMSGLNITTNAAAPASPSRKLLPPGRVRRKTTSQILTVCEDDDSGVAEGFVAKNRRRFCS